jgi:hypothetical protein
MSLTTLCFVRVCVFVECSYGGRNAKLERDSKKKEGEGILKRSDWSMIRILRSILRNAS